MSFGAGGLAQMTYNPSPLGGGGSIGLPGSGFASRGKAANIKKLSVAPPSKISTIDENQASQPRTSRSHLLAGLRTAPKSPSFPTTAPPTQLQFSGGLGESRFARDQLPARQTPPKTAGFQSPYQNQFRQNGNGMNMNHHPVYSPEQILAPPDIHIADENGDASMDPTLYDELLRTNQYLAQQQMRLQQQLINVTAAAQHQFQTMSLNKQSPYSQAQMNMSYYNQQLQSGVQPIIEPVPNNPGVYTVYNPLTGQATYFFDQNAQSPQQSRSDQSNGAFSALDLSHSPPPPTPTFRAQVSPPPETATPMNNWRSNSPPKLSQSPPREEASPLPPPSANAFRPSHRKNLSLVNNSMASVADSPRTAGLKSNMVQTPLTGTFGPGQAREGEHPVRQPRGPPSLEELVAKPTTKHEGSKNFLTRQRRRALGSLARGVERRGSSRGNGSVDSVESGTPTSERELNFSSSSDNDADSVRSGSASLSGKPSFGNLRASPISAIGSERKERKERSSERNSVDSYTAASLSSEEGSVIGGKLVEIKVETPKEDKRRSALLSLASNAEKRRSLVF